MAPSIGEVPVFTDTNLGTRIAVAVVPDITARDFKREAERVHLNCYPNSGEIMIYGLMVKRKSRLYHLPESLPIKYAFKGRKGTWFLHVEAMTLRDLSGSDVPQGVAGKFVQHLHYVGKDTDHLEPSNFLPSIYQNETREGKRHLGRSNCLNCSQPEVLNAVSLPKEKKNKRMKKFHYSSGTTSAMQRGCNGRNEIPAVIAKENSCSCGSADEGLSSRSMMEVPSDMSSEVISVTGIIKRYFPSSNEVSSFGNPSSFDVNVSNGTSRCQLEGQPNTKVDNKCSSLQDDVLPKITVKTPLRILPSPLQAASTPDSLRANVQRSGVGKRLILASSNLRISGSKQKPAISLCRFGDGKMLEANFPPMIRSSVFEISDGDD